MPTMRRDLYVFKKLLNLNANFEINTLGADQIERKCRLRGLTIEFLSFKHD
jgi:hypothetical protein